MQTPTMFSSSFVMYGFFFFQAEDGIRAADVTGVQTCALPISGSASSRSWSEGSCAPSPCSRPRPDRGVNPLPAVVAARIPSGYERHERNERFGQQRERERSEEHTSELQSRPHLVCRLLLEKKK